ncbi:hypothetical protein [Streptomyces abyssalis]|uniref:hypothetical protein n=1 Tax=Streptomyces abyssalis TaxID=933944 RepID=UPI001112F906|nr:hypothetical protein [Streptomyces abyssalis]
MERRVTEEYRAELRALVDSLYEQRDAILLAGPALVSESGEYIAVRSRNIQLKLDVWASRRAGNDDSGDSFLEETPQAIEELLRQIWLFARRARQALDDDGISGMIG